MLQKKKSKNIKKKIKKGGSFFKNYIGKTSKLQVNNEKTNKVGAISENNNKKSKNKRTTATLISTINHLKGHTNVIRNINQVRKEIEIEKKKKFINWAKKYLKEPYFETILFRFNGYNIEYLVYEPPNRGDGMWALGVFNEKADHYNEIFPKILNPNVLNKNNTTNLLNFFNSSNKNNDETITQLISKYKEQEEYINKLYQQEKYNELDEWWINDRVDCFKQIGIYLAELNGFHDITDLIFGKKN